VAAALVNGTRLAYRVYGSGEPLVLAHFSSASKEMWEEQIGVLSERYRVVVYDDDGYTMRGLVADQRALLEQLGIERAYVGGISMGGAIALQFALAHPDMVRALLLCDTTADIADTAVERRTEQGEPDLEAALALMRERGLAWFSERTWLEWARPLGITSVDELPPGAKRHIERVASMQPDGLLGTGRALSEHHVLERVGELAMPVLILTGEHDFLRQGSERLKERLPEARFVVLPGAAHISSFWQPDVFARAVLEFLVDVEAGRPVAGELVL